MVLTDGKVEQMNKASYPFRLTEEETVFGLLDLEQYVSAKKSDERRKSRVIQ
jgi:hypothetical protein